MKKLKVKKIDFKKIKARLKDKPVMFGAVVVVLLSLIVILGGTTLLSRLLSYGDMLDTGYTEEVKSITFESDGYGSGQPGGVKVTKSASWTDKYEATIEIDFDSIGVASSALYKDVILVLDTSISMTDERVLAMNESIKGALDGFFANGVNSMALVTFASEATTWTNGFTKDKDEIIGYLDALESHGATNYYLALKDVEKIMDNYTPKANTEVHMIFVTDGRPTEGVSMNAKQAEILKAKFPNLVMTAIQFEMSDKIDAALAAISDHQYYSNIATIGSVLLDAYSFYGYYEEIVLTDYIHDDWFYVDSVNDIEVTHGSVELVPEGDKQKIVWTISDGTVKTGSVVSTKMKIKAYVQEEYRDDYGYLPTNRSTAVTARTSGVDDVNISTTDTPVLKSWYDVIYDSNLPVGCSSTYSKTERYFPFSNVTISGDTLSCAGYQFRDWYVTDKDVQLLSDKMFLLPNHDVTIGAEWSVLSIAKSMEGNIYEEPTLYNYLKSESVLSTTASINYSKGTDYDGVSGLFMYDETKNSTYPTLFYRGQVDNNNVVFADKCWKIVMTTETGGIKIAYNGTATDNKCTSTGSSIIDTSNFNYIDERDYSLADGGYMTSSTRYKNNWIALGKDNVFSALGMTTYEDTTHYSGSYYYASSVSAYTNTTDGKQYMKLLGLSMMSGSSDLIGKYTAFQTNSSENWSFVRYIVDVNTSTGTIYYVNIYPEHYTSSGNNSDVGGYLKDKAENVTWYYANDVTYENGVYTLVDSVGYKPINFGTDNSTISGNNLHYVCMEDNAKSCSTVAYIFNAPENQEIKPYYIELTDGNKVENAIDSMLNVVPTKSSTVKNIVDTWYVNNLESYSNLLEVNEYTTCSNREADYIGGWNPNEEFLGNKYFFNYAFTDRSLWQELTTDTTDIYYCRDVDTLSVANGRLTYPISLLTLREVTLAGNANSHTDLSHDTYLTSGDEFWLMEPYYHHNLWNEMFLMNTNGGISYLGTKEGTSGVRPVVALDNSVHATGTGTADDPYIIKAA